MLENDFKYLINQFGVSVYFNEEIKSRKAILSSQSPSDILPTFDDRTIHCDFKIKRGDTITYNDTTYLVYSDVQEKRKHEYKAIIRPMTNEIELTYMTDGYYEETDRYGNPIWIIEPKEVTEYIPCIAVQDNTPKIDGGQIATLENRITVIAPDNNTTENIEINDKFHLKNHHYKVHDINLLQQGLIIMYLEWEAEPA